jgi:hypothetical protein
MGGSKRTAHKEPCGRMSFKTKASPYCSAGHTPRPPIPRQTAAA